MPIVILELLSSTDAIYSCYLKTVQKVRCQPSVSQSRPEFNLQIENESKFQHEIQQERLALKLICLTLACCHNNKHLFRLSPAFEDEDMSVDVLHTDPAGQRQ